MDEYQYRVIHGVPVTDIEMWNKHGHGLLKYIYPSITSLKFKKHENTPPTTFNPATDGVRIVLNINGGVASHARASIHKDGIAAFGLQHGLLKVSEITGGRIITNTRISAYDIVDVKLVSGTEILTTDSTGTIRLITTSRERSESELVTVSPNLSRLDFHFPSRMVYGVNGTEVIGFEPVYGRRISTRPCAGSRSITTDAMGIFIGGHESVTYFDDKCKQSNMKLIGLRDPIEEISVSPDGLVGAASRYSACVWDVRWPHHPLHTMEAPGIWPIGPPSCSALLLRSHIIEICRGGAIFHHSLLDGRLISTSHLVDDFIAGIGFFHSPYLSNSRVDAGSTLVVASCTRPTIDNTNKWQIV